jgi:hypothetical protein
MGSILAALKALGTASVASSAWRSLAEKFFLRGMLVALIPFGVLTAMNYFVVSVVQFLGTQITEATNEVGSLSFPAFQMGLIGTYIFQQLNLNNCISYLISAHLIRFTIRAIPFLHL